MLTQCPPEILFNIAQFLDTLNLFQANRYLSSFRKTPYLLQAWLTGKYGVPHSLYFCLTRHEHMMQHGPLLGLLIQKGAVIPRFLAQICYRDSRPLYKTILKLALDMDPDLDVRSDDIQQFEFLSNDLDNNIDKCLDLIISHHLILLPELSPAVHIRLFQLMNKKPDFVLGLIASGHLPLAEVNDSLVQLVLSHEHPNYALLQRLVDVGFTISDACLLTLLKQGSIVNSLEQISQLVPKATLRKHCLTVLKTMFGGEGGFHPFSCTKLVQFFEISEQEIAPMILHKLELQIQDPKFSNKNLYCPFKTRAFPKTDPVSCWFWIRNFYGPGHWFSLKSYQDLLLWIDDHRNGFDGDQEQKIKKALNVFLADKSVFSPEHLLTLKSIHGQPFKSQIACRILFDYSSYLDTHHLPMYQNQIWKKHLDDILGSKWHRHSSKSFDLEPPYQQFTLQKTLKMFKPESWSFRRKSQPETDLFMEIAYKMHQQISGKLNNQLPTFKTR